MQSMIFGIVDRCVDHGHNQYPILSHSIRRVFHASPGLISKFDVLTMHPIITIAIKQLGCFLPLLKHHHPIITAAAATTTTTTLLTTPRPNSKILKYHSTPSSAATMTNLTKPTQLPSITIPKNVKHNHNLHQCPKCYPYSIPNQSYYCLHWVP